MLKLNQEVNINENQELEEELQSRLEHAQHYFFAPSITKQRIVGGKTYIVRSYFTGGKDFGKTLQRLAIKQANNAR